MKAARTRAATMEGAAAAWAVYGSALASLHFASLRS